ncbi:EAL and HDOD domain-containing protein [Vibrio parahaemolyticus]|uniref:EAL and HDOD domain-containing protein n=1 Tax=Vibrio parahaemolyticus TaxID=670 RepID=UPI0005C58C50
MKIYMGRQPILDRERKIVGYELLFRDSEENRFPMHVPQDVSTAKLLINSFLNMDFDEVVNGKTALINFPIEMLRNKVSTLLPNKRIVIEILESVEPNEETKDLLRELHRKGYRIALDDFIYSPEWDDILRYVSIIKIDIQATPLDTIPHVLEKLKSQKVKILAEKVETYEEYQECRKAGFQYFQGYFFSKPEMISGNEAEISNSLIMQIYREATRNVINFDRISKLFEQESTLTYQTLKLVNTRRQSNKKPEIKSVKQALVYLGEQHVRRYVCLLAIGKLGKNKPAELVKMALTRSRFFEQIATLTPYKREREEVFLMGLLSTLDALLDKEMSTVMDSLPVNDAVKDALVSKSGRYYPFLAIICAIERAEWDKFEHYCSKINIDSQTAMTFYKNVLRSERQDMLIAA